MTSSIGPGDRGGPAPYAVPDLAAGVTHLGTAEWCWARLLTTTDGVLSFRGGNMSLRVGVGYSVEDGQVLIPTGTVPGRAHLLGGTEVTLALGRRAEDGLRWVVRATGVVAHRQGEGLLLEVDRLRGYHEASYDAVGWT